MDENLQVNAKECAKTPADFVLYSSGTKIKAKEESRDKRRHLHNSIGARMSTEENKELLRFTTAALAHTAHRALLLLLLLLFLYIFAHLQAQNKSLL